MSCNNCSKSSGVCKCPCYLKCDDTLVRFDNPIGTFGTGVCLVGDISDGIQDNGSYIFRFRDNFQYGGTSISGPAGGQYISVTVTNNWKEPALFEVEAYADCLARTVGGQTSVGMSYITAITEELNVEPRSFGFIGATTNPRDVFSRTQVDYKNFSNAPNGAEPNAPIGDYDNGAETSPIKYTKILQPNETRTVYLQAWAIINNVTMGAYYDLHCGFNASTNWKLTRNAKNG